MFDQVLAERLEFILPCVHGLLVEAEMVADLVGQDVEDDLVERRVVFQVLGDRLHHHPRAEVHRWRRQCDAIAVGTGTVAIDDPRSPEIVVIVDSDLYMVFRVDAEEMRKKAVDQLPPGIAKKLRIVVAASHNHHGPDTAFDVNHAWYEYMSEQVAAAIVEAVSTRRPARTASA